MLLTNTNCSECVDILERTDLTDEEKTLIAQIIHNMQVRGLIWESIDEVIATTECVVLTKCLKDIWEVKTTLAKNCGDGNK